MEVRCIAQFFVRTSKGVLPRSLAQEEFETVTPERLLQLLFGVALEADKVAGRPPDEQLLGASR